MKGGVCFYLVGAAMMLALASCGRSFLQTGERAAWRHQAEVDCLKSGSVKIGTGVVQIQPIEGPGMCGADFPLKVALLGEGSAAIGYGDDLRPPGAIPNGSSGAMPNWPPTESYPRPVQSQPVQSQPTRGETLRWVPGPQGIDQRRYEPAVEQPRPAPPAAQPRYMSPVEQQRSAPPLEQPRYVAPVNQPRYGTPVEQPRYVPNERDRYAPANEPAASRAPAGQPMSIYAPGVPQPDDIPDDAILPAGRAPTSYPRNTYNAPGYEPPRQQPRSLPALGPMRGPQSAAAATPAALTPAATLACPLVSALDRWVSEGVQPAALRWFGSPVTEIKQISAYSCRSMVGAGSSHISEHAFGNALDVAGFVLADGRKITVKDGWRGAPEEQGFLHDVHTAACETFSTVLAPGYNAAHYDHIHVDLMRRASGRHPCRPDAVPGEVAAAKARSLYASKRHGPTYTGSLAVREAKRILGIPGEDGEFDDDDAGASAAAQGWPRTPAPRIVAPATTEITGSIAARAQPARTPPYSAGDAAIRMQEIRDAAR
jgi:hypothetical protein